VSGSNPTCNSDRFSWFFAVPPCKYGAVSRLGHYHQSHSSYHGHYTVCYKVRQNASASVLNEAGIRKQIVSVKLNRFLRLIFVYNTLSHFSNSTEIGTQCFTSEVQSTNVPTYTTYTKSVPSSQNSIASALVCAGWLTLLGENQTQRTRTLRDTAAGVLTGGLCNEHRKTGRLHTTVQLCNGRGKIRVFWDMTLCRWVFPDVSS
jgi:hypothetical protein